MEETTIGAVLFDGIEENPYLNELYDAILYNYGRQLFGLTNLPERRSVYLQRCGLQISSQNRCIRRMRRPTSCGRRNSSLF